MVQRHKTCLGKISATLGKAVITLQPWKEWAEGWKIDSVQFELTSEGLDRTEKMHRPFTGETLFISCPFMIQVITSDCNS